MCAVQCIDGNTTVQFLPAVNREEWIQLKPLQGRGVGEEGTSHQSLEPNLFLFCLLICLGCGRSRCLPLPVIPRGWLLFFFCLLGALRATREDYSIAIKNTNRFDEWLRGRYLGMAGNISFFKTIFGVDREQSKALGTLASCS